MSSRSNDIHTDIRDLLGTETLTPEMERVVDVMRAYRPRVDIDASYRNKLRKSLLTPSTKKSISTRPSWYAWMGWIGTSCAALIVTLGVVRMLYPVQPDTREHTPLTVESPLPEVATLMQDATSDTMATSVVDSVGESTESLATHTTTPMARMTDTEPVASIEPTPTPPVTDIPSDMLADTSASVGLMMMATPEPMPLAKTAVPTTTETPVPDISGDIGTEIQDMVWEINAIIREAPSLVIPDYPTEMPVYTKDGVFTREEESLLAGSGITSTTLATYPPDILKSLILERRGIMTLSGAPIVRYISYKKGNQSILVPTVIYTTTMGTTIEVALVRGY